jgi:hypothetical protein
MQHTHSDRLERWLGADAVARLSVAQKDFYKPIAVHGVPGAVYAMPGGDFCGEIRAGSEMSAVDRAVDTLHRLRRQEQTRLKNRVNHPRFRKQQGAFATMSALITAATTAGKMDNITFSKVGTAPTAVAGAIDLWTCAGQPSAGAAGAAAPGGTAQSSATTGAMPYWNAGTANTNHFTTGYAAANFINTLLLYDRLFSVAVPIAGTSTAVTGAPSRYTNTSTSAADSAAGNFVFPSIPTTLLPATAHTYPVGTATPAGNVYTNSGGTATRLMPVATGISACALHQIDLTLGNWFMPLMAGDVGVQKLTNVQMTAVATGTVDMVMGHPIAYMPCPIANMTCIVDGINTAFNLEFIFDNACLALIEMPKPATNATTYSGMVTYVGE